MLQQKVWLIGAKRCKAKSVTQIQYVNLGYKTRIRKGWFLAFSKKNMPAFRFLLAKKKLQPFCYVTPTFYFSNRQSRSQRRPQSLL